jgi:hypothetical protein
MEAIRDGSPTPVGRCQPRNGEAYDASHALKATIQRGSPYAIPVASMGWSSPNLSELLRALTEDIDGRYAIGEILHERAGERLADAREAAGQFDDLLKTEGETKLQEFLELHPWLLGLDYARIRARQPIPRGAVDFLLERFDGFHDLLELKSPRAAIFETHGKDTGIQSPSSYRLSRPLALALAQVHAYRDALRHESATEELYGLPHTREPRITILIGLASELSKHQKRLLGELNRSLHRVEIVPFDILGRRARAILDNVERYLDNKASSMDASVSGGGYNTASGEGSSVSAGSSNIAGGGYSSISGGLFQPGGIELGLRQRRRVQRREGHRELRHRWSG